MVIGGVAIGVLPLIVGLGMFARGIRRMRVQGPISPYVTVRPQGG